jgi:hypothetical protein
MEMLGPSHDYTNKDFDSIRQRLVSGISSVFPTWTDTQAADFGTILMDSFAFVGDVAMFNLDAAAIEAKWGTATQLRSLLRLAKMIAYTPKGASAANTTVTLSVAGLAHDVTIPAGTSIKTVGANPVSFQTLGSTLLTSANFSASVEVENSVGVSESFSPSGLANQVVVLGQTPYLANSLVVTNVQGTWTQVVNFLGSRSLDLHYTVDVDANDLATVKFGNGTLGALPIGTTTLNYRVGGGAEGMVGPDTITDIQGTFYDSVGTRVTVQATNPLATVGGAEKETVATIKVQAPPSLRAGNRTVSRVDFETRARAAAGVGRAIMLTTREDPTVDLNTGMLWVVPTGLGFLTPTLRANIAAQFSLYPYAPSFVLDIMDPEYLDIFFIHIKIFLQGSAKASMVKAAILANLSAWFALNTTDSMGNVVDNPTSNFGYYLQDADGVPVGSIAYSDLFNIVRDTPGVRKVGGNPEDFLLTSRSVRLTEQRIIQQSVHADILITPRQYPRFLGAEALTLIDGDTGATL